ncbi:I78 family peptidase inhibitor [Serratia sp. NPDC078593]|uniref:I78 family peptidase inhibitor n=1 Tax=unclassified Serratia (in: enterobacteria) TaxID=2647522 RepID=UPI0037D7E60F
MKFYQKTLMLAALMALAACNSTTKNNAASPAVDAASDSCGAAQYQNYVGKPLSSLQGVRIDARQVRAIPYNAAVTMDFNMSRLNFLADRDDKIIQVYCG